MKRMWKESEEYEMKKINIWRKIWRHEAREERKYENINEK